MGSTAAPALTRGVSCCVGCWSWGLWRPSTSDRGALPDLARVDLVDFGDRCVRCARVVRLPPASSGLDTDGRRGRAAALPSSRTRSRRVRGRGWPPHDPWCGGPTYGTQWCAWQMYSTTVPGATLLGHEGTADDTRMRSSRYRDYCSSPRHSPKFEVRTAKRTRARRRRCQRQRSLAAAAPRSRDAVRGRRFDRQRRAPPARGQCKMRIRPTFELRTARRPRPKHLLSISPHLPSTSRRCQTRRRGPALEQTRRPASLAAHAAPAPVG